MAMAVATAARALSTAERFLSACFNRLLRPPLEILLCNIKHALRLCPLLHRTPCCLHMMLLPVMPG